MEEKKIDRRVRKTKAALLSCLTKLMLEKKVSDITVKELTDLADVNRSTFYLYYKDIFDMVEQIETEMLASFTTAFQKVKEESNSYTSLLSFYTYIFEYVNENSEMCKILLGPDGDYLFIEKFKKVITETKPPFDTSIPKIKLRFLRPYIITGCVGIIQQWLRDNMDVSPKEMALIIMELSQNTIGNV